LLQEDFANLEIIYAEDGVIVEHPAIVTVPKYLTLPKIEAKSEKGGKVAKA